MRTIDKIEKATNLVICIDNAGYELDLEPWQVYEVVPDESLETNDLRVIDETGEDYIYPASYFVSPSEIQDSRSAL
ncbi:hypothetical protein BH23ACT11_BH23ACT11_29510 [soil metagenome]|jgi:hypothetical protein